MAETLRLTWHVDNADKPEVQAGSRTVHTSISVTNGQPHYVEHTIADAFGEDVLWAAGDGGKDTFAICIIVSNKDIFIELKNDASSPDFVVLKLIANVPLILPSDDYGHSTSSALDGAVLVEATDYDQITQIEAHNDAVETTPAADAVVKLWIWD